MRYLVASAAALVVLSQAPANAAPVGQTQSEAQTQAGANADAKPKKERNVCRSIHETGSNIPKSECHTATEWTQIDASSGVNQNDMRHVQSQMNPHG